MSVLTIRLFGSFSASCDHQSATGQLPGKLLDLFCYLLVNRNRRLSREVVASVHWGNTSTSQSKKYLRTALWQLRVALKEDLGAESSEVLKVDDSSVCLETGSRIWLDTAELERVYTIVRNIPTRSLAEEATNQLKAAAELYRGDLLEGIYNDWCLYERERLQNIYLGILEKLLSYCEFQGECESGREYGHLILHHNPISERIHQRLMRLYHAAGDRAGALAQYARCARDLQKQLGVGPSKQTAELYRQIRADMMKIPPSPAASEPPDSSKDVLGGLNRLRDALLGLQEQIETNLTLLDQTVESVNVQNNPRKRPRLKLNLKKKDAGTDAA